MNSGGLAPVAEETEMPVDVPHAEEPNIKPEAMPMHPIDAAGLQPQNIEDLQVMTPQQDRDDGMVGPEFDDMNTAAAIRQIEYTGEDMLTDELKTMNLPVAGELDKGELVEY